jgi:hypothetical protein
MRAIEIRTSNKNNTDILHIAADSRKLILSNMLLANGNHAHNILEAEESLWKHLQEAYPAELKNPLTLSAVMNFLKRRKIAMADLSSPDSLLEAIKTFNIHEILFPGSFNENNVFYRFYIELLGQQLTRGIRQQRCVLLDPSIFGRPVWLTVLYSTTGNANVGIARSQQFQEMRHLLDPDHPVHDFRIRTYREKFALTAEVVK